MEKENQVPYYPQSQGLLPRIIGIGVFVVLTILLIAAGYYLING